MPGEGLTPISFLLSSDGLSPERLFSLSPLASPRLFDQKDLGLQPPFELGTDEEMTKGHSPIPEVPDISMTLAEVDAASGRNEATPEPERSRSFDASQPDFIELLVTPDLFGSSESHPPKALAIPGLGSGSGTRRQISKTLPPPPPLDEKSGAEKSLAGSSKIPAPNGCGVKFPVVDRFADPEREIDRLFPRRILRADKDDYRTYKARVRGMTTEMLKELAKRRRREKQCVYAEEQRQRRLAGVRDLEARVAELDRENRRLVEENDELRRQLNAVDH